MLNYIAHFQSDLEYFVAGLIGDLADDEEQQALYYYKTQIIGLIKLECPKAKSEKVTSKAASIAFENLSKKKIDPFHIEILASNPKIFKLSVDESVIDEMDKIENETKEMIDRLKKEIKEKAPQKEGLQ